MAEMNEITSSKAKAATHIGINLPPRSHKSSPSSCVLTPLYIWLEERKKLKTYFSEGLVANLNTSRKKIG